MRSRFETLRQSWWPGTARSREKANIIRDADVVEAIVQQTWAAIAMKSRTSAHLVLIEVCQMYVMTYVPAAAAAVSLGTTHVTATSRMKPKTTDTTTDMTMPHAAPIEARRVSSLMCADAS